MPSFPNGVVKRVLNRARVGTHVAAAISKGANHAKKSGAIINTGRSKSKSNMLNAISKFRDQVHKPLTPIQSSVKAFANRRR